MIKPASCELFKKRYSLNVDEKQSKQFTPGLQVIGVSTNSPQSSYSALINSADRASANRHNFTESRLRALGFGPCSFFKGDLVDEPFPYANSKLWQQACNTEDRKERQRILYKFYEIRGYKSGTDYPTSLFIDDLLEMYPDAKVSLSTTLNLR